MVRLEREWLMISKHGARASERASTESLERQVDGTHWLSLLLEYIWMFQIIIEGSLEVKLPTIWDRWKAEMGKRQREEESRREKIREEERVRRKQMQMREKVGKSRNTVFFQWFVAPEGRKVGSLKRRVRSHLARWEMKKCTPLWREAHFEVKIATFGPLLEVEMSKKCTPLWREAHFEVKMYKPHHVRTTFGGSDVVSRGRRKGLCTWSKVSKTWGFCSIFNYNHHYTTLHSNTPHYNYNYTFTTLHYITLHYTPLHYTTLDYNQLHYTTLHYTTLHYATLHYTTLHCTTLHYTTFHYTRLHYTTLHSTTLHYNYTTLHSTTVRYTPLHSTTLNYTTLHSTTLHYTTLNYTTLHYTTLHYIPLHYTTLTTATTTTTTTTILHLLYATLHYTNCTTLHYTPPHYTELHYTTDRQVDR